MKIIWMELRLFFSNAWQLVINNAWACVLVPVLCIASLGLIASFWGRIQNLPPGPNGFQLLWMMICARGDTRKVRRWLKQKYGDVYSFYIGRRLFVILSSHEKIKEAFVKRKLDFAGRPKLEIAHVVHINDEHFFIEYYKELPEDRKFFHRAMQNTALNTASSEEKIGPIIQDAMRYIRQHSGLEFDPKQLIERTMAAIFTSVMFSSKYKIGDPPLDKIVQMAIDMADIFAGRYVPLLEALPRWLGRLVYIREIAVIKKTYSGFREWAEKEIDEHNRSLDPSNPHDVTDVYLINRSDDEVCRQRGLDTLLSFLGDSVETTASAIRFVLLYIVHHPRVQERLQAELDRVVGRSRVSSFKHRKALPYLQAVILESMRLCDMTSASGHHCALQDTSLDGYTIPKTAWIFGDFLRVHHDPELFSDPEMFNPDRFIDAEGRLTDTDYFVTFSMGSRACLGESLVKTATFLLIANMLHEFRFSFPSSRPLPPLEMSEKSIFFAVPHPYQVIPESRGSSPE